MTPNEIAQSNTQSHSSLAHSAGDDAALRIHQDQAKRNLENRLRLKKNEIIDQKRKYAVIEESIAHLEHALAHSREVARGLERDVRELELAVQKNKEIAKEAGEHLREKDTELQTYNKDYAQIEQEIERLRAQLVEKERALALQKLAHADIAREKEGFRRQHELETFGASAETGHLREKTLEVGRYKQEAMRTENAIEQKKRELAEVKKEMMFTTQEINGLEVALH